MIYIIGDEKAKRIWITAIIIVIVAVAAALLVSKLYCDELPEEPISISQELIAEYNNLEAGDLLEFPDNRFELVQSVESGYVHSWPGRIANHYKFSELAKLKPKIFKVCGPGYKEKIKELIP